MPAAPGHAQSASLTREQALALEDELIKAYSDEQFQRKLHAAWDAAGDDLMRQGRARQEVCFEVQARIIMKYGFEATKLGVNRSVAAFAPYNREPEFAERSAWLSFLVNPALQRAHAAQAEKAVQAIKLNSVSIN